MIRVEDDGRIRVITLLRPEALNAFNEALYDATTEALLAAATDPGIAVVLLTGSGRAFSAGTDVVEMAARVGGNGAGAGGTGEGGGTDGDGTGREGGDGGGLVAGKHGFPGLVDALSSFPKPLLCAVNGLALGVGATMLGLADLVF